MAESTFLTTVGILTWVPNDLEITSYDQELTGGVDLGEFSEEGFTLSQARTTQDIRALGGRTIRTIVTDASQRMSGTLLESTPAVRKFFYNAEQVNGRLEWDPKNTARGAFVFDALDTDSDGNLTHVRHWIRDGQVSETGDVTFAGNDVVRYSFTLTAHPVNGKGGIISFYNDEEDSTEG